MFFWVAKIFLILVIKWFRNWSGDLLDFDLIWLQKWSKFGRLMTKIWESQFSHKKNIGTHRTLQGLEKIAKLDFVTTPLPICARGGTAASSESSEGGGILLHF